MTISESIQTIGHRRLAISGRIEQTLLPGGGTPGGGRRSVERSADGPKIVAVRRCVGFPARAAVSLPSLLVVGTEEQSDDGFAVGHEDTRSGGHQAAAGDASLPVPPAARRKSRAPPGWSVRSGE